MMLLGAGVILNCNETDQKLQL